MCVVLIIIKFFCLACIHNNPLYPWLFSSWDYFLNKWFLNLQFYFPPHASSRDISLSLHGAGDTFVPMWFWLEFCSKFSQKYSSIYIGEACKICLRGRPQRTSAIFRGGGGTQLQTFANSRGGRAQCCQMKLRWRLWVRVKNVKNLQK